MALQERNDELVALLRPDFIAKNDSVYAWATLGQMYTFLPGLIGLWSMSSISLDDKTYIGNTSAYDWTNERLGIGTVAPTQALTVDGITRIRAAGATQHRADIFAGAGYCAFNGYDEGLAAYNTMYLDGVGFYIRPNANNALAMTLDFAGTLQNQGVIGEVPLPLPFTNSGGTTWADYGGGFQVCDYSKFGDIVLLRGLAKRTAGAGNVIATLPAGYRPLAYAQLRTVQTDTGIGRIDIYTDGTLNLITGGAGWVDMNIIFRR